MAGIYIHIPFCASRCIYCDFYSTTHGSKAEDYTAALINELRLRADYLKTDGRIPTIETIYLGGGTPSTLPPTLLRRIFDAIYACYEVDDRAEVTIEANPDDLSLEKIRILNSLPVNRLSIGVQTFDDNKLRLLHRRHNGDQAIRAVHNCQDAGLDNISIDLIYGLPEQTLPDWEKDLDTALRLQIQHLSAYALIYEQNTPLWKMRQLRQVKEAPDELSLAMFELLRRKLTTGYFEHYEISNFARPGFRSRHNSSYWKGIPYLGCGPSAHSYDGNSRQWNISDLNTYIDKTGACRSPRDFTNASWIEKEELSIFEKYNDLVITSLRTSDGLNLTALRKNFGTMLADYCLQAASPHIRQGLLEICSKKEQISEDLLKLTHRGIFLSDGIMSDLLYVED